MTNLLVSLTLLVIIGLAIYKVISEKRRGTKCVGCHLGGSCSSHKQSNKKQNMHLKMGEHIAIKELT